uniref:Uncharacterized protein n=1 Tax=Meloidogyne hapla TaxID=6305 RepID=A0A1I8AZF8_MELHA
MLVKFNFKKLIILFTILLPILVIYVNGTGNGDESPNQREASPTRGNSSQHEEGVTRERSRSPPHRRMTWALAFTRMGQGSRGTEPIPAFEIFRNPATMLRNVATSEFEQVKLGHGSHT